jgi:hypothetical protein
MKSLFRWAFLGALFMAGAAASAAWDFELTSCSFYVRQARAMNCRPDGYLDQFGYRYCREFEQARAEFSPQGVRVLARLKSCLIRSLREVPDLSCDGVAAVARESHVSCYLENGFCDLSQDDKFKIFAVVWREVFDPAFAQVMLRIQQGCGVGSAAVN